MRIISGSLKGRSIDFLKNSETRPLKDSVRESIFNIIKHSRLIKTKIQDSSILDLYSGIGSFGIESLSRGAEKVTFVEKNLRACSVLKKNLNKLNLINKSKIFSTEIEKVLNDNFNENFNIFFFDPPFKDFEFYKKIKLIKKNKIFKKSNLIVIHRESSTDDNLEKLIKVLDIKIYGRSKIIFGVFN